MPITMSNAVDLTGQVFGRLTVVRRAGSTSKWDALWECRCSCGATTIIRGRSLRAGTSKSCGCLNVELFVARVSTRDGLSHTGLTMRREYAAWRSARSRCNNPKNNRYEHYGARGIRMDPKWVDDFGAFLRDIGACPDGYTLERIDVNRGYEPDNVTWAPRQAQGRNKRTNRLFTFQGETLCVAEWAERLSIDHRTLRSRLTRMPADQAFILPVRHR